MTVSTNNNVSMNSSTNSNAGVNSSDTGMFDGLILGKSHFDEIKGVKNSSPEKRADEQRVKADTIVKNILAQGSKIGGPIIIERSIDYLFTKKRSPNIDDNAVASIFEGALRQNVQEASETYEPGNQEVAKHLENAGFLTPQKAEGLDKYYQIFWDHNGPPRPRQIISEWCSNAAVIGAFVTLFFSSSEESKESSENAMLNTTSTPQSKASVNAILVGGIAYLIANVIATLAILRFAGPVYKKR